MENDDSDELVHGAVHLGIQFDSRAIDSSMLHPS